MAFYEVRCIRCGECAATCPRDAIILQDGVPVTDLRRCIRCGECASACASEARQIIGEEIPARALVKRLARDQPFFDQSSGGITISGGEPLMQPEFLLAVLEGCQDLGMHTALDTCGYAPWQIIDQVRAYVDLFLYDIKFMDDELHQQYTGVSNALILDNLRTLAGEGHAVILRMPVIPGINDSLANLEQVAELAGALPGMLRLDLLPYHTIAADKYRRTGRAYPLPSLEKVPAERMEEIARFFQSRHLSVSYGG